MSTNDSRDKPSSVVMMSMPQLVQIAIVGAVSGLVIWGLAHLLDTYIYKALLCHGSTAGCSSSLTYGSVTAMIIGGAVGLFALVRLLVFRPLLVALASIISLWGIVELVQPLAWYGELLACLVLFGLAYALYAWVARLRAFWIAAILMVVLIIVVRLVLFR
jgi:hypothetical protein